MSSSEDEDLSRVADAVDPTFLNSFRASQNSVPPAASKLKSDSTLEEATHYNDVSVAPELQKKLAKKLSRVIENIVEFVEAEDNHVKKSKIKGGVKLFTCSTEFLSAAEEVDTTELHNKKNKHVSRKRKKLEEEEDVTEEVKVEKTAVSAEYIMLGEETKHWKSRRKEKLFKYKAAPNSKLLISLDNT